LSATLAKSSVLMQPSESFCSSLARMSLIVSGAAESRQQELAIRAALGAGWGKLARELLFESVTLGMWAALRTALAYVGIRLLLRWPHQPSPARRNRDRPWVLVFTFLFPCSPAFSLVHPVFKYAGASLGHPCAKVDEH